VGNAVGAAVGSLDGSTDGSIVGAAVWTTVGGTVGSTEGLMEGTEVGEAVGSAVGVFVGGAFPPEQPQPIQSPVAVQENDEQLLLPTNLPPLTSPAGQSASVLHVILPHIHPPYIP
jgi:phage tail tape-measure protein